MGGSVFASHAATVRIDRAEHDAIVGNVAEALLPLGIHARALPSLRSKASFGDVDMVCARSQTHGGLPPEGEDHVRALARRDAQIAQTLGADAYHRGAVRNPALHMLLSGRNGPVQLDLMSIEDDLLEFAARHLSWGDAGAMAAAIAQQMGVKMGMTGIALAVRIRAATHRLRLDLDYDQALDLIGLDADRHRRGFDTVEEVYEWLAAGRYFNPLLWSAEFMTNKRRHRAMKRDSFAGLQEWIQRERPQSRYDWGETRGARMEEWTERLLDAHPEARTEMNRLIEASTAPQGLRAFFNGEVIRRHIDVDDDALQHVMNNLRKRIGNDRLHEMMQAQDHEALDEAIRQHLATIA